jgi:hypothetical protein
MDIGKYEFPHNQGKNPLDRGLLEDRDELEGVLVVVLDGEAV